ncbi:MAG: YraN family protein [Actinobacteria bacterium]|nr:YraN family protein [Actinomycetota bacterium]
MSEAARIKLSNKTLGAFGEQTVVDYLLGRHILIVDRNWRIREGEVDIIAQHLSGRYAFVEVKTRRSLAFGHPFEAISREKAYRLQRLSLAWLAINHAFGEPFTIDCAAVLISPTGQANVEYREAVL